MTSLGLSGWRRLAAALLAIVLVLTGPALARAADPAATPAADGTPAPAGDPAAAPAPAEKQEAPSLQIQDEGPGTDSDRLRLSRARIAASDQGDEKPFWKSWVFWTVTGALVLGAVGMIVYTSSGSNSNLAPCPVDVAVSLGCFGAGR